MNSSLVNNKTSNNGERGMQAGNRKSELVIFVSVYLVRLYFVKSGLNWFVDGLHVTGLKNQNSVLLGLVRCRCKMKQIRKCSFLRLSLVRLTLLLWQVSLLVNYLRFEAGANCCLYVMESSVRVWLRLGLRLRIPLVCLLAV